MGSRSNSESRRDGRGRGVMRVVGWSWVGLIWFLVLNLLNNPHNPITFIAVETLIPLNPEYSE